jgi:hypothetical protein
MGVQGSFRTRRNFGINWTLNDLAGDPQYGVLDQGAWTVEAANTAVLYVGVTVNYWARMADHQRSSPWWHRAYTVTIKRYGRLTAGAAAEASAIRARRNLSTTFNTRPPKIVVMQKSCTPVARARRQSAQVRGQRVFDLPSWKLSEGLLLIAGLLVQVQLGEPHNRRSQII